MSFESAGFVPADPGMDLQRVEAWLTGLPYAFRDRRDPERFLVVDKPEDIPAAIAAREADPRVFPGGVVVWLRPDRVVVDPHPWEVPWRAREVVTFLLSLGRWDVTTEYGHMGIVDSLGQLFEGEDPVT